MNAERVKYLLAFLEALDPGRPGDSARAERAKTALMGELSLGAWDTDEDTKDSP